MHCIFNTVVINVKVIPFCDRKFIPIPLLSLMYAFPLILVDLYEPWNKHSWNGYNLHRSCNIDDHSCQNGIMKTLYQREIGSFSKNCWSFIRVIYLTRFPTTTPRSQKLKNGKQIEFKFHPGCKNAC